MYDRILLPTDGSKNSERAIVHALEIAKREHSEIIILNVVDSVYLTGLPEEEIITKTEALMQEESEKVLKNIVEIINNLESEDKEDYEKIKLTPLTKEGNAPDVILKITESEDINMIVIASSGKHLIDRFLLGSVTEKIVRHAKVPIMVIP
ncbi:MAG: universal stress protein [Methanobacteriaceae archaeon]|nr:universal stress protein [Methanobacteriaceae archaeon]